MISPEASRILVTGGGGLIGAAVVEHLAVLGAEVVVLEQHDRPVGADAAAVWITGSILDAETVEAAAAGADAVVHTAGRAGLEHGTGREIYETNALGTFTVFDAAASAGAPELVFASSINANGLPLNPHPVLPTRFPWGEDEPAHLADPYSLSKAANEQAGEAFAARTGMSVTGLRFPLVRDLRVDDGERFAAHIRAATAADPRRQAVEGWSYLDVRDAARAVAAALRRPTPPVPGILVAADDTYLLQPTEEALARVLPSVPVVEPIEARRVPLDLSRARELLGFEAELHLVDLGEHLLLDLDAPGSSPGDAA